jgi:hypothetical protein
MNKWLMRISFALAIAAVILYMLMNKETEQISFMYADF